MPTGKVRNQKNSTQEFTMRLIDIVTGATLAACVFSTQADVVAVKYTARTEDVRASILPAEVQVTSFQPSRPYEIIGDLEVRGVTSPVNDFVHQHHVLETVNVDGLALYERAEDADGSEMVDQALREEASKHGVKFVILIRHAVARISGSIVMHYVRARAIQSMDQVAAP